LEQFKIQERPAVGTLAVVVAKNTVADQRRKLVATGQIDQLDKRRGRDGKLRPAKHRRIIANTPKEAEKAMEAIRVLPPSCAGKILDVGTATRRARKKTFTDAREQQIIVPTPDDDIRIFHGGFQQLEATASLPASSVRLVATDIPYGKEFVSQIPDLAAFANRVLIEGGIFLTYYGHLYLPDLVAELGRQLNWGWIMCSTWGRGANIVHHPCGWSMCSEAASAKLPLVVLAGGQKRSALRCVGLGSAGGKLRTGHLCGGAVEHQDRPRDSILGGESARPLEGRERLC
jgi:hypothetical protein